MNVERASSDGLTWFKSSYSGDEGGACVEVALDWRKSSHSSSQGDNCVEVAADWRKSRYSGDHGGDCVEVAACPQLVHVRDSKLGGRSPQLAVGADAWVAFLAGCVAPTA